MPLDLDDHRKCLPLLLLRGCRVLEWLLERSSGQGLVEMTELTSRDARTFLIVGASLAGAKAAETLRAEGFAGRVILVGEEPELPYERPPLSKGYLLGTQGREKAFVHERGWYHEQNIELRTGVRVEMIDPAAHTVTVAAGERLDYDKLLLTTGSVVRRLQVPGADLDGVHYLRGIGQADALRGVLGEGVRLVVVGGGWIGLEVTAAARAHRRIGHVGRGGCHFRCSGCSATKWRWCSPIYTPSTGWTSDWAPGCGRSPVAAGGLRR